MFGRIKTAWRLLGIMTKMRRAVDTGGGSAFTGGLFSAVGGGDPFGVGRFAYDLLEALYPGMFRQEPAEMFLGTMAGLVIGWLLGTANTLRMETHARKEQGGSSTP